MMRKKANQRQVLLGDPRRSTRIQAKAESDQSSLMVEICLLGLIYEGYSQRPLSYYKQFEWIRGNRRL